MTFDQAIELAGRIRRHYSRLDVVAIGRFVPIDELDTTPERWGVSIRIDREGRKTVWAAEDVMMFAGADPPRRTTTKKPKPVEQAGTPLLF